MWREKVENALMKNEESFKSLLLPPMVRILRRWRWVEVSLFIAIGVIMFVITVVNLIVCMADTLRLLMTVLGIKKDKINDRNKGTGS